MDKRLAAAAWLGLADALGFVLGSLAGWKLGAALGYDFIGSRDWGTPQLIGLVLIVAGAGLARMLFRALFRRFLIKP